MFFFNISVTMVLVQTLWSNPFSLKIPRCAHAQGRNTVVCECRSRYFMKIQLSRSVIKGFVFELWRYLLTCIASAHDFLLRQNCLQLSTLQLEGFVCNSIAHNSVSCSENSKQKSLNYCTLGSFRGVQFSRISQI